ncbi:dihydroorotate dehydrogenase [bacterium]|nr:dihydroorotate dehydrogenase [bacterium]
MTKKTQPNLSVTVGGIRLRNPVLLASGTCGYGTELRDWVDFSAIGGLAAKSVTLHPRAGNPMPRVAECRSGMLNAIGLANVGIDVFCEEKMPVLKKMPCAVIANVAGSTPEEYLQVVKKLNRTPGVDGLEINVSCPNVHAGGIEFGRDPNVLQKLVGRLRRATALPLWVKLSPNVTDIISIAKAAEAGGADALTVMNTLIGMQIDIVKRRPVLANRTGGLSGPAVKPVALHLVYKVSQAVAIPVVGVGGIELYTDALEFILAGATAIQVGTATFRNPAAAREIVSGLSTYCRKHGISKIQEIIGAAQT